MVSATGCAAPRTQSREFGLLRIAVNPALLFGLVLIGCALLPGVPLVLAKATVDPFLHSTSVANLLLLGGALTLVGAEQLLADSRLIPGLLPGVSINLSSPRLALPGLVLLSLAALIGLLMYWQTLAPAQAALATSYQVAGEEISYNQLFHNHTGKAGIAILAAGMTSMLVGFDAGSAFANQVSTPLALLSCLATISGGALLLACNLRQRYWWQHRPAWALALLLASIHAVKSTLDGGLLSYPWLLSCSAVTLLVGTNALQHFSARTRALTIALVVMNVVYVVAWLELSPQMPSSTLQSYLALLAVYAWLCWQHRPNKTLAFRAVSAGLLIYLAVIVCYQLELGIGRLLQSPGSVVALVSDTGYQPNEPGQSLWQQLRMAGEDPLKPARHFIVVTPSAPTANTAESAGLPLRAARFRLIPQAVSQSTTNQRLRQEMMKRGYDTRLIGSPTHLSMIVDIKASWLPSFHGAVDEYVQKLNFWVHLHRLSSGLRAAGFSEFVLLPEGFAPQVPDALPADL